MRETGVELTIETRGPDHAERVRAALREAGYEVSRCLTEPAGDPLLAELHADASLQRSSAVRCYEVVAARLQEFIDAQQLEAGDRLMSERELAERLGVSRTSVRQALTALRVIGLVEIRHGAGVYLLRPPARPGPGLASEMAGSEVDHPMIWEVREAVEVQAARLAAGRRTEADLRGDAGRAGGDGPLDRRRRRRDRGGPPLPPRDRRAPPATRCCAR